MEPTQTITGNEHRIGRFTSSGIHALMSVARDGQSFGKPALTYIEEKQMERRLGRSINTDTNSKPTSWGNLVEQRAFDLLGLDYSLCSSDTLTHKEYGDIWSGSPDLVNSRTGDTVCDVKCPFTLKSFCLFADSKTIEEVRANHPDGEKYYWQLVSNAILTDSKFAELVVYCPYQNELEAIREMANNYNGDQNKVAWINWANDYDLPYLVDGGYYQNLNIIRFEVSQSDKELLTQKVLLAGELLTKL